MKNETINIYLSNEQRKKVDSLKVKYRLSLTTIVDILCELMQDALFLNADKELEERFKNKHLYALCKKTSIKVPRFIKKMENVKPCRYVNNILQAYLRGEMRLFIKSDILEGKNGFYARLEKELTTREDNWWEYNRYIRMQKRFERTNK